MATNVTWDGTTYSIPAAGEYNWSSLSAFLIALGNKAAVADESKQSIRKATATPVTVSATSDYAVVTDLTVAGPVTVNLPAGVNGQIFIIVDGKADAATNNITINRAGSDTVAGQSSLVLNKNRQVVMLQYNSGDTDWKLINYVIPPGQVTDSDISGAISTAGKVSGSAITSGTIGGSTAVNTSGTVTASGLTGPLTGTVGAATPDTGAFTTLSSTQGANLATSSGNVGIGTFSPANKLQIGTIGSVSTATPDTLSLGGTLKNAAGASPKFKIWEDSTDSAGLSVSAGQMEYNAAFTNAAHVFYSGGSEKMRLSGSGNVGIGTASPSTKTEVFNTAAAGHLTLSANDNQPADNTRIDLDFQVKNSGHVVGRVGSFYDTSTGGGSGGLRFYSRNTGVLNEQIRLTPAGNVGIGTSSPAAKLNVIGNLLVGDVNPGNQGGLQITTGGASPINNRITYGTDGSGWKFAIGKNQAGTVTEQLTIQDNGNVGIGKTNPATTLDVNGTVTATSYTGPSTAINGLLPSQSGYANKYLKTDGSGVLSWSSASGGTGEINAVLNSSGADGVTGWTAGTSHNSPVAFSGTNNPLDGIVPTAFSFTAGAGTVIGSQTNAIGIYNDMALPTALQNRKLKIEFAYSTPASSAGTWAVALYQGSTKVVLSTDSGGDTILPSGVTGGKFTAYFDSTNASAYRLLLVQRSRTNPNNLYLTNVIVGPGIQPQGAVVSEWQNYTPTGGFTTNTTYTGRYRRVGDSLEVFARLDFSGAPNVTNCSINIPSGLTIDGSKISTTQYVTQLGSGELNRSGSGYSLQALINNTTSVTLTYQSATTGAQSVVTNAAPLTLASGDIITIRFMAPIAEWAGSGTVQLAQNDVEFAADDGSNDVFGPNGAAIPTITQGTGTTVRELNFTTPRQVGDNYVLELRLASTGSWTPAPSVAPYVVGGSSWVYGVEFYDTGTAFRLTFGNGGLGPNGAFTGNGSAPWSNSYRWRVRKASSGAAVGFGIVQPGVSAGLVSASGLPGNTTGNAIASGYVGQIIQVSTTSSQALTNTNTYYNVLGSSTTTSLTLTAGIWLVYGQVVYGPSTLGSGVLIAATTALSTNASTPDSQDINMSRIPTKDSLAASGIFLQTGTRYFNVSSSTSVYLLGLLTSSVNTTSGVTATGVISAVRVA